MTAQPVPRSSAHKDLGHGGQKVRRYLPATVILAEALLVVALSIQWFPSLWAVGWATFDLDQSAGSDVGVTLSEVASHPEAMWGRTVTVSANVHEVINDQSMIIGTSSWFHFRTDTLLVLAPSDLTQLANTPLEVGRDAHVKGVVRPFEPAALESELSISLNTPSIAAYDGKVVLIAQQISVELPDGVVPGDPEFGGSAGYEIGITVYDLTHDTDEYVGETVTVSDEVEEGLLTSHAFWLGDEKLLVVSAKPLSDVFVETTAYVTGEVHRFDLGTVEATTGVDLNDDRFQSFKGEPFIYAEMVHVVA